VDRIPVVLCIDDEPDESDVDRHRRAPWTGFEELQRWLSRARPRLAAITGAAARFTWFLRMDPQIAEAYGAASWAVTAYRRELDELRAQGDELGVHAHAYRWDGTRGAWIVDDGSQPWVDHCVRSSLDAFEEALGQRCPVFRFGDHWMNDATARLLEERGVGYDLTLEPGKTTPPPAERTGAPPDLTRVPHHPYRPSREDFRTADWTRGGALWMLPVTTGRPGWTLRLARRFYGRVRGLDLESDVLTLNPGRRPMFFRGVAAEALASGDGRHLVAVIRADAGGDHLEMARLRANMEHLLTHPLAERFVFCTPDRAIRLLEASLPRPPGSR
jgi:hypothetical protein